MSRFCLYVSALAGILLLVTFEVTPAQAWTLDTFKWNIGTSGTYCLASTVTAHGLDWINTIQGRVNSYNAVSTTGVKPTWTRTGTTSCSTQQIIWNQASLAAGLCGYTLVSTSGSSAVHATISYSSSKTYYLPGSSGNCGLYYTTLHEFGHSQGLQHTTINTAVMWNIDNGATSLQSDDIAGLRARYP